MKEKEKLQFSSDGVWEIKLSALNDALEAAYEKGKVKTSFAAINEHTCSSWIKAFSL